MRRAIRRVTTLVALLAGTATVPALAQDRATSNSAEPQFVNENSIAPEDTIIVRTGRPEDVSRRDVQRQARDIAASGQHLEIPLARFEDRLCPGILGLQVEYAMLMIDRIRDNANELGVRLMPDGCEPNFFVIFSDDSQATLAEVVENNPYAFQFMESGEKRDMLKPGPVHVWLNIEPRTLTGVPVAQSRSLTDPPVMQVNAAHSRIYTTTRRDISSAMIIFDRDEVGSLSIGQLADYATMRGLAQTEPADSLAMNSILSLFNDEGPFPGRLSSFDQAYLRALYDWIPNLPAAAKLGNVNRELRLIAQERGLEE